jgi:hypothetical protein
MPGFFREPSHHCYSQNPFERSSPNIFDLNLAGPDVLVDDIYDNRFTPLPIFN